MTSTINSSLSQALGWVLLSKESNAGAGISSRTLRKITPAGTLALIEPVAQGAPVCAVFPGYTGDAMTHKAFINAAIQNGIGVLCVTPAWESSTRLMREKTEDLYRTFLAGPARLKRLRYIRGVSFGSHLALAWLSLHGNYITKTAFVTPCSAGQLTFAAIKMKLDVRHDDQDHKTIPLPNNNLAVRILPLPDDEIVPATDPVFLGLSTNTKILPIAHGDHLTAGEEPETSRDLAAWFGESNETR